jgi:prepilin signal peptidase PulO-like enzyme (type II secretory pathway)
MAGSLRKHHVLAFLVGAVLIIVIIILFDLIDRLRRFSSPLDTLLSLVLLVIFGMGACGLSYELGRHLARGRHPLVAALLGALVVNLVNLIPFLGFLVFCVFSLLALGVVLLSGFGKSAEWLAKLFTRRQAARPPTATA